MEEHLFKNIEHLSSGNQRKAALSVGLLRAPHLLIIDDPTRSLDPAVSKEVLLALHFLVNQLGITLLYSSKQMREVNLIADSVVRLAPPSVRHPVSSYKVGESSQVEMVYSI